MNNQKHFRKTYFIVLHQNVQCYRQIDIQTKANKKHTFEMHTGLNVC